MPAIYAIERSALALYPRYGLALAPLGPDPHVMSMTEITGSPIVLVEFDGNRAIVDDGETEAREVVVTDRILRLDLNLLPENH